MIPLTHNRSMLETQGTTICFLFTAVRACATHVTCFRGLLWTETDIVFKLKHTSVDILLSTVNGGFSVILFHEKFKCQCHLSKLKTASHGQGAEKRCSRSVVHRAVLCCVLWILPHFGEAHTTHKQPDKLRTHSYSHPHTHTHKTKQNNALLFLFSEHIS